MHVDDDHEGVFFGHALWLGELGGDGLLVEAACGGVGVGEVGCEVFGVVAGSWWWCLWWWFGDLLLGVLLAVRFAIGL